MSSTIKPAARLECIIREIDNIAVALSGGIDSLVLSAVCSAVASKHGLSCTIFHAVSAAVPEQATVRVKECADKFDWNLQIIDANEFSDSNYRNNPVNRCFFCKSALYGSIRKAANSVILSGTNTDDLAEFRPGLQAAENFGVRHPFVEDGIDKKTIRLLASEYGIGHYSELSAAPCLASRVETGVSIEPDELRSINAIELFIAGKFSLQTVRCRLRQGAVVIEIDQKSLPEVQSKIQDDDSLQTEIRRLLAGRFKAYPLDFTSYRTGSAFLHQIT